MRTGNPMLRSDTFGRYGSLDERMTVQGTAQKAMLLLVLLIAGATWVWNIFFTAGIGAATPWMLGGLLGGLVLSLVTIFAQRWAAFTAPLYALAEGLFIGGLSAIMEQRYPGIVLQAVGLTFGTTFAMLTAYSTRLIPVTDKLRVGIIAATAGIALIYLATLLLGFFGITIPYIHESGLIGIGFSLVVVVVAALNLLLDFDAIEQGALRGAPKTMEWYGAFALMVTLIWLYIEFLRLLGKLRNR